MALSSRTHPFRLISDHKHFRNLLEIKPDQTRSRLHQIITNLEIAGSMTIVLFKQYLLALIDGYETNLKLFFPAVCILKLLKKS